MPHSEQEIKVALAIKEILDENIQTGPWQDNSFLKGIKKKLEELRDQFAIEVGLDQLQNKEVDHLLLNNNSITEVYISLYQSQGSNIHKWQEVVASLVRCCVGRPVYKDEEAVKAATHLSDRNPNNAYAVVKVNSDAILPDSVEQPRFDREGRKLIVLREGAITLTNVVHLVHTTGQYRFVGNFLVKRV